LTVNYFTISLYGLSGATLTVPVPLYINRELNSAQTPKEVEQVISDHEAHLADLLQSEFLVCDTATELMADVLRSKGLAYQIICGVNDRGESHSYIKVGDERYDPTHQGFGGGEN
jgi:hypothetical protein